MSNVTKFGIVFVAVWVLTALSGMVFVGVPYLLSLSVIWLMPYVGSGLSVFITATIYTAVVALLTFVVLEITKGD